MTDEIKIEPPAGVELHLEDSEGDGEWFEPSAITMSTCDAQQLAQELDRKANPWSEPGLMPTEPGEYWLLDAGEVWAVDIEKSATMGFVALVIHQREIHPDDSWDGGVLSAVLRKEWRFRRRWTPEPPR